MLVKVSVNLHGLEELLTGSEVPGKQAYCPNYPESTALTKKTVKFLATHGLYNSYTRHHPELQ